MEQLGFAAAMEASIRQEIEHFTKQAPSELNALLGIVGKFQVEFELLLDRAQCTDINTGRYPAVDATLLLGSDDDWQVVVQKFAAAQDKTAANLTLLWMIHSLVEKSGQFYQQAGLNSAHPSTRLFMSSLTETKNMLRRRIDGVLRVMYNEIWSDIGFAPVQLGKD